MFGSAYKSCFIYLKNNRKEELSFVKKNIFLKSLRFCQHCNETILLLFVSIFSNMKIQLFMINLKYWQKIHNKLETRAEIKIWASLLCDDWINDSKTVFVSFLARAVHYFSYFEFHGKSLEHLRKTKFLKNPSLSRKIHTFFFSRFVTNFQPNQSTNKNSILKLYARAILSCSQWIRNCLNDVGCKGLGTGVCDSSIRRTFFMQQS